MLSYVRCCNSIEEMLASLSMMVDNGTDKKLIYLT